MKYIVIEDENGKETIHMWTKNNKMTHYDMYHAIANIKSDYENPRRGRSFLQMSFVVGAGFYDGTNCHGESISLHVKSRGDEDTRLVARPSKMGAPQSKNSLCKCGSGKKHKRCCG